MKKLQTVILVIAVLSSAQAKKFNLKLNLEVGKEYHQRVTSNSGISQEINGRQMNIVMKITGEMIFKVTAHKDDVYDMDVNYERLDMTMQMPQMSMEFSSEKTDDNDILSKILKAMKGKVFSIKMTDKGKVTEVNNIETIYGSAFDDLPQMPAAQVAQIKEQIAKAYGEEAFKGSIEMAVAVFPDKRVKKGETWTVNTKLNSGMEADMASEYTLAEVHPDHYLIKGTSTIETVDKDAYVKVNGMPMKYDLSGKMTSEIQLSRDTGWIIKADIQQEMDGNAYIQSNEQVPDGMKIPMVIKTTLTVTE